MANMARHLTQMSIDLKKYRVRIHKESLHLIGDPAYIQFLVSVEAKRVAIRAAEGGARDALAHKVGQTQMGSELSCEIYSRPFINRLRAEFDCFREGTSYRLTGVVLPAEGAVIFPLVTVRAIESEGQLDEQ